MSTRAEAERLQEQIQAGRDQWMLELMTKGRRAVVNGEEVFLTPSAADLKLIDQWLKERQAPGKQARASDMDDLIKNVMETSGRDGTVPEVSDTQQHGEL